MTVLATSLAAPTDFPYRSTLYESCPTCVATGLTTPEQADTLYREIVAAAQEVDPGVRFYTAGSADYYDRVGDSPSFRWVDAGEPSLVLRSSPPTRPTIEQPGT